MGGGGGGGAGAGDHTRLVYCINQTKIHEICQTHTTQSVKIIIVTCDLKVPTPK